jgi:hypothetical protein
LQTLVPFRYVLRAYIQFHIWAKNPGTPAVASDDALRHYGPCASAVQLPRATEHLLLLHKLFQKLFGAFL